MTKLNDNDCDYRDEGVFNKVVGMIIMVFVFVIQGREVGDFFRPFTAQHR